MPLTTYGDISPRTAAWAATELLKRGFPYLNIEKFGQSYQLPRNSTRTARWRRYFLQGATGSAGNGDAAADFFSPLATTPLLEGVTPTGIKLANQDYEVTLQQYGDYVSITDVIQDTHEDPVLNQVIDVLGEQAAMTIETLRYNVLKAGTNVFYANGASRAAVNTALTIDDQRSVTTALTRQNARKISRIVSSTPRFNNESVEAAYIGLIHPDLETDVRKMTGFIPTKNYGTTTPWESEIGSVEQVRYLTSTIYAPFADAGGAAGGTFRSTTGTNADVYPVIYLARDAFGMVPLKGENAITPMVVNPKPIQGDPLAQRGSVGWKTWNATVILQDAFMARLETAATL